MRRRIVLVIIIMAVLGALVGGAIVAVRRSSQGSVLRRAELALEVGKYDKAIELAQGYLAKQGDWRGELIIGRAHCSMGRYKHARAALEQGLARGGDEKLCMALADTYSLPGRKAMREAETVEQLREAAGLLESAQAAIARCPRSPWPAAVREYQGINYVTLAYVLRRESDLLRQASATAASAGARQESLEDSLQNGQALNRAQEYDALAIGTLLSVVREDPARPLAASALVEHCIKVGDRRSLQQAREIILSVPQRPPLAHVRLIVDDLSPHADASAPHARATLSAGLARIEEILSTSRQAGRAMSPADELVVKLYIGELKLRLGRLAEVESLCGEFGSSEAQSPAVGMLHAKLLIKQGKLQEAREELWQLAGAHRTWADAHYTYGLVSQALGQTNSAEQAMRTVIMLEPTHAEARQFIIGSLLAQHQPQSAFQDAQELYQAHPSSPAAILLYVRVACLCQRPELAIDALGKTVAAFDCPPVTLLAATRAYDTIRLLYPQRQVRDEQLALLNRLAQAKPQSSQDRLAIAGGLDMLGRLSEAEDLLSREIELEPDWAAAHFELGEFYSRHGRSAQAMEHLRKAAELEPSSNNYRLALVRELVAAEQVDQGLRQLRQVKAGLSGAGGFEDVLAAQLQIVQRQDVDVDKTLRGVEDPRAAAFYLAYAALAAGQADKGLEICNKGLASDAQDSDLLLLAAEAYRVLGQDRQCAGRCRDLLALEPRRLANYDRLAQQLYRMQGGAEPAKAVGQVAAELRAVGGADGDLVELAVGNLYYSLGRYGQAADVYAGVSRKAAADDALREQASVLAAGAFLQDQRPAEALACLPAAGGKSFWQSQALLLRVQAMLALNDPSAEGALGKLAQAGLKDQNFGMLEVAVRGYLQVKKPADAERLCKQVMQALGSDARPCLLAARMSLLLGRDSQADEMFEKAIALQAGDLGTYVLYAESLDARQEPQKALEVLDRMSARGQAGANAAGLKRLLLLLRWGLTQKAADCCREVAAGELAARPALCLDLGRILARLRQPADAAKLLRQVPQWSASFQDAQQELALLETKPQDRLARLQALRNEQPNSAALLELQMQAHLEMGQGEQALAAYRQFTAGGRPAPSEGSRMALQILIDQGQLTQAAELAARIQSQSPSRQWRQVAALLAADDPPHAGAAALLVQPDQADATDAALGVLLDGSSPERSKLWLSRLAELESPAASATRAWPALEALAALSAGDAELAKRSIDNLAAAKAVSHQPALQLLRQEPAPRAQQARELLKATVAAELGMTSLARLHARAALQADAKCAWAAMIAMQTSSGAVDLQQLQRGFADGQSPIASLIEARLAVEQGGSDKALAPLLEAVKTCGDSPELLMQLGQLYEKLGQLPKALETYERLLAARPNALAANNAAYVAAQLWPTDQDRLAKASAWIEQALKDPSAPEALYDTSGWIAYLQGRGELARKELQRAVVALPASPEAHYHLGMACKASGLTQLGQLHLRQAVALGAGPAATKSAQQAVSLAQQELAQAKGQKAP